MEPLTVLTWAAVWAVVSATTYFTVTFILLTIDQIIDWFTKYAYLRASSYKNSIGFTVQRAINSRRCNIVQGVLNQKTGEMDDFRVIEADSVDEKIKQAHSYGRQEVALWI
jgi:hypothetical protein